MEYTGAAISLLLSPTTLLALALYTLITFVAEWSGAYLAERCEEGSVVIWLAEHLYIPWFNLLALALFISMLYPQIFGLNEIAKPSISLKAMGDIALLISLLLPLIPGIGRAEFTLPIQGIIIIIVLFRAVATSAGHPNIDYWPSGIVIGMLIAVSIITMMLSRLSASILGEWLDERLERQGFERALQHGIQLTMQCVAIFIYALSLGAQLTSL